MAAKKAKKASYAELEYDLSNTQTQLDEIKAKIAVYADAFLALLEEAGHELVGRDEVVDIARGEAEAAVEDGRY